MFYNGDKKTVKTDLGELRMEELRILIEKLDDKDECIVRRLCAIVQRYLEKRGRL